MNDGMLIVGAGLAGLTVAEALRAEGYASPVTLLGEEAHPPYHRPPLSKGYLLGETPEAQLTMRAPAMLAKRKIALETGVRVTAIDRSAREVTLADGSRRAYAGLALCTGSRARRLTLDGVDAGGVHTLRTLADAQAISAELDRAHHIVVIGGGFIGLEIAAAARQKGKQVTVLETLDRLMARVVAPLISRFYFDLHRANGVEFVLGGRVSELVVSGGHIAAVRTGDGREFAADLVIVGIGIVPNAEIALAAGIDCDVGIVVDACSRTSDAAIVAAGDCTACRLDNGSLRRLESIHNASEQAKSAAAALLGKARAFNATPWFWSEQYGVKLQMVGLNAGFDAMVTRGDPAQRKFSAFYFRQGKLIAADSVNLPGEHLHARKLLDQGLSPLPAQLADPAIALSALLL
jgi:3-phenylpropionate/trans-cinnamate dioxygenase ferredoxin reductase subunit